MSPAENPSESAPVDPALAIVDDPLFGEHRAEDPHPERPERLDAARAAVARADLDCPRVELPARDATPAELERVHKAAYLERLGRAAGTRGHFDADTYYGPQSVAAALRAAGGAVALVQALRSGQAGAGAALLRPPGHHARPESAMGFCLLNNIAVAAAAARADGAQRVAIVDWDVHHGNGTQEMFYEDPSVLYVSLHQFPFYPGTGAADESGSSEGRGYTVNVPLSAGADDAVYFAAIERIVAPVLEQYDPELLLISAGFDAHRRDPLASMALTDWGYAKMLSRLLRALPRGAAGRVALMLEGGYDLTGLSESLRASLEVLGGHDPEERPLSSLGSGHSDDLGRAERVVAQFWRLG
jgi:acetoin utilization deacetylase AcuC-like enzyme